MSALAARLCEHDRSEQCRREAETLRQDFNEQFWSEQLGCYVLALDGEQRPCAVRTSNAGHCLLSGIVPPDRARRLATTLMEPDMFSGWGIRTVGRNERRYNPISYHNGSIWPHDSAIVAMGLAQVGYRDSALRILEGLFEASLHVDLHRLPELFCGFARREGEGPTLYPVACSPQAWAACAPFALVQAALGLSIDGRNECVTFEQPTLPSMVDELHIDGLQVGSHRVDLALRRYPADVAINVVNRTGPVRIVVAK